MNYIVIEPMEMSTGDSYIYDVYTAVIIKKHTGCD